MSEKLDREREQTKMLSADMKDANTELNIYSDKVVNLEREQRNFDEVQKAKRLVDEELAETKTQLKEVHDELQLAYSNNERNLAEMEKELEKEKTQTKMLSAELDNTNTELNINQPPNA